jgi:hypothetical protein
MKASSVETHLLPTLARRFTFLSEIRAVRAIRGQSFRKFVSIRACRAQAWRDGGPLSFAYRHRH